MSQVLPTNGFWLHCICVIVKAGLPHAVMWKRKQKRPEADFFRGSGSRSSKFMLPEVLPEANSECKLSPHFTQRIFSIFPQFPSSLPYFPTFVSTVTHYLKCRILRVNNWEGNQILSTRRKGKYLKHC